MHDTNANPDVRIALSAHNVASADIISGTMPMGHDALLGAFAFLFHNRYGRQMPALGSRVKVKVRGPMGIKEGTVQQFVWTAHQIRGKAEFKASIIVVLDCGYMVNEWDNFVWD